MDNKNALPFVIALVVLVGGLALFRSESFVNTWMTILVLTMVSAIFSFIGWLSVSHYKAKKILGWICIIAFSIFLLMVGIAVFFEKARQDLMPNG